MYLSHNPFYTASCFFRCFCYVINTYNLSIKYFIVFLVINLWQVLFKYISFFSEVNKNYFSPKNIFTNVTKQKLQYICCNILTSRHSFTEDNLFNRIPSFSSPKLLIFIPAFFTKSFAFIVSIIFTFVPLIIASLLVCPSDTIHWK